MSTFLSFKNRSIRFWITMLIILSMTFTLLLSITAGYRMTKQTLIGDALSINEAYAKKMADSTEIFFQDAEQKLNALSISLSPYTNNQTIIENELNQLFQSDNSFNSIAFFDNQATIVSAVPESNLIGQPLQTIGTNLSLEQKQPVITEPYTSITGRLIVFISVPVWDTEQNYQGFLSGTIYLEQENALGTILQKHFYKNGSYLYVVDSSGNLIYHPQAERIGENVTTNPVVQKVIDGQIGHQPVTNTQNTEMLAGFAPVPSSGWGIISQTPKEEALQPLQELVSKMLLFIIPLFILLVILSLWISEYISRPLKQLSNYSEQLYQKKVDSEMPVIHTWYHEANVLKKTISIGVSALRQQINTLSIEAKTDPLTNLANRRGVEVYLDKWIQEGTPFSLMVLDLDHFKQINDKFGHEAGDQVLLHATTIMKQETQLTDVVARFGGEEFIVLLPHKGKAEAVEVGEKIRKTMEQSKNPVEETITVSIGIAEYPVDENNKTDLFYAADKAMYRAKKAGRNRTFTT